VIIQRDDIQDQISDIRARGAQQCLRAPGAILKVQPDHGGPLRLAHSLDHLSERVGLGEHQANRCGGLNRAAQLYEIAARYATPLQVPSYGVVFFFFSRHDPILAKFVSQCRCPETTKAGSRPGIPLRTTVRRLRTCDCCWNTGRPSVTSFTSLGDVKTWRERPTSHKQASSRN